MKKTYKKIDPASKPVISVKIMDEALVIRAKERSRVEHEQALLQSLLAEGEKYGSRDVQIRTKYGMPMV